MKDAKLTKAERKELKKHFPGGRYIPRGVKTKTAGTAKGTFRK